MWTDPLPLVVIGIAAAVLAWDVTLAGWITTRREAPRLFTQLTAFCGLLVVPALVVSVASGTEAGARTISGITWLQPLVAVAFVVQVLYAVGIRLVSPVVGIPILLYDLLLAVVAIGDYLVSQFGSAPLALQAAVSARDVIVGIGVGRAALLSSLTALVPMLAPAYPARWRISAAVRAGLVLAAVALTTLLAMEWPRGVAAVRSYDVAVAEPMQARPRGDFLIGVRFLPVLNGVPLARTVRSDTALFGAFDPDVVLIVLDDEGTRPAALDSLARVLEPWRVDSATGDTLRLAVGLRIGRRAPVAGDAQRVRAVGRVLERLRPDVIFPALPDPVPSWLGAAPPSLTWWQATLRQTAQEVRRVRPRTHVGWSATRLDATDSAVYAWAASSGSPVTLLGAVAFPGFSGLPAVDARLRAFERWHAQALAAGGAQQPHWLTTVGGLPHAHGDAAQVAAIRRALAWGSRREWIGAAIVGEPADYDGWTGLRASNGRIRSAMTSLGLASRRMREVRR
ncbi:MAG TPA: hypothetical protein DGD08_14155 [Gemmatimonas aurantiaca]|uniref:Uncharacterized protein n=2 Tax=Gemmatimonas aurantiaca TaxID=173480 RepID=A0A3D4VB55_9BACT|nr:hypothetical protein [Gemmatimonas aurantiaca]BAH39648.1 hypothetical membrane protein [Gemmatimonas aurantiaca T-27]HCT58343.1 hypothetical protein [Gemmatimonas aurantiaca]